MLRPPFPYSAGPGCCSFSAEVFAILRAARWSRQPQQECHFSLLSGLVLATLSAFFLSHTFGQELFFFSSTTWLQWVSVIHFSQRMTRSMSWPGVVRCSSYPMSHVVFSYFLSPLFWDYRCLIKFLRPTGFLCIL